MIAPFHIGVSQGQARQVALRRQLLVAAFQFSVRIDKEALILSTHSLSTFLSCSQCSLADRSENTTSTPSLRFAGSLSSIRDPVNVGAAVYYYQSTVISVLPFK